MPVSQKIASKYARLFADKEMLRKLLGGENGTMPADLKAIQATLAKKLADRKIMESLVNDYMKGAGIKL
jgi:hypothetical protein